jgi:outer membrane protein insertion porin family
MMGITFGVFSPWLNHDFCRRLTLCLAHFVWQGSAVALAYVVAVACLRRSAANTRYVVAGMMLALMAACLPTTFCWLSASSRDRKDGPHELTKAAASDHPSVIATISTGDPAVTTTRLPKSPHPATVDQQAIWSTVVDGGRAVLFSLAPWFSMLYAAGVLVMLFRLSAGIWGGRRLRQSATVCDDASILQSVRTCCLRLGIRAAPAVAYCQRVSAPLVIGVLKPTILLPAVLATGLSGKQLELVLMHELAHIRRFDLAVNVVQRLVESLLFFHPAVWWLSGQVRYERENACDDLALTSDCPPTQYADALVRAAELCSSFQGHSARFARQTSLASTGQSDSQFKRRIMRLLNRQNRSPIQITHVGVLLSTFALASFLIAPALVRTQEFQPNADSSVPTHSTTKSDDVPRAQIVKRVRIEGNYSTEVSKMPKLGTCEGQPFDSHIVQEDARTLASSRKFLDVRSKLEPTPEGMIVIFRVVERPTIEEVTFVGNQEIRSQTLRKKSQLEKKQPLDPYAVEESRRRVEAYYKEKEYNHAEVTTIEGTKPNDRRVVFLVDEGTSHRTFWTIFDGNTIASSARLRSIIGADENGSSQDALRLNRNKIVDDEQKLYAYYRGLGFFTAKIGHELEFNESKTSLTIRYVINEGTRYSIRNVSFIGNEHFQVGQLNKELQQIAGKPFDQTALDHDLAGIRDVYGSYGYVFADIQHDLRLSEDKPELDLVYNIAEGKQYRVGPININIAGDDPHTTHATILDRMSLRPGDIVDTKKLREDERRLRFSSIFNTDPSKGSVPKIEENSARDGNDTSKGKSGTNERNSFTDSEVLDVIPTRDDQGNLIVMFVPSSHNSEVDATPTRESAR